jgi:hypothetical protein
MNESQLVPTAGLEIWQGEYILNFFYAIGLQFQPTNNAGL